jgi:dipeptidyl aminopeptidase/acylaminoacyl peptidase
MSVKRSVSVLALAILAASVATPSAEARRTRHRSKPETQSNSLIPRSVFLGNPTKTAPRISPDGTKLAYLAPSDRNVLNVWVRTIGMSDDRMVTNDTLRGIRTHFWAQDGRHLIYLQDVGGNENFHAYAVDVAQGTVRDLTPHEGVRATNVILDRNHPDQLLLGMNLRDKKLFDMYRVNLATGESKLDTENPGDVLGWATDPDFVIRAAIALNQEDGSQVLRVRDSAKSPWRDLVTLPPEENGNFVDFSADGKAAYIETSIGSDVTRLVKVDLSNGRELETLATDPRCDVGAILVSDSTHQVQAVGFNYQRNEWKVLDPALEPDFRALRVIHEGDFSIVDRDRSDQNWLVSYLDDDGPTAYYAYYRPSRKGTFLFVSQPALETLKLGKREPVEITTRDGIKMVSYLTRPPGGSKKELPLVLLVHGGPWGRDVWGFDPIAEWLASRGYAVLQPNYRGSAGFGKKFLHLGDKQWGGTMQDDLTDAVRWAVREGIADPKRVAIMGGSYGGYATLAGLAFTPDLYACGVDIVGPSNLKTLLQAVPPYWATQRKIFELRMGDVERDSVLNRKLSPLFHADQIRAPLLIGQGLNDPRVNVRESDQIAAAVRARGIPVDYVVYTDEGHGFLRPENRVDFYGRTEEFLSKYLGGRAEPWIPGRGSSAQVK